MLTKLVTLFFFLVAFGGGAALQQFGSPIWAILVWAIAIGGLSYLFFWFST